MDEVSYGASVPMWGPGLGLGLEPGFGFVLRLGVGRKDTSLPCQAVIRR